MVVERTLVWLHPNRRLRVRSKRRADLHDAFRKIGCILICDKQLSASFCETLSAKLPAFPTPRGGLTGAPDAWTIALVVLRFALTWGWMGRRRQ